jgi:hypothetical protein
MAMQLGCSNCCRVLTEGGGSGGGRNFQLTEFLSLKVILFNKKYRKNIK